MNELLEPTESNLVTPNMSIQIIGSNISQLTPISYTKQTQENLAQQEIMNV